MGGGGRNSNSNDEPKEEIDIDTLEHKRVGGVHNWGGGSTHNSSLGDGDGYHYQVLLQEDESGQEK